MFRRSCIEASDVGETKSPGEMPGLLAVLQEVE